MTGNRALAPRMIGRRDQLGLDRDFLQGHGLRHAFFRALHAKRGKRDQFALAQSYAEVGGLSSMIGPGEEISSTVVTPGQPFTVTYLQDGDQKYQAWMEVDRLHRLVTLDDQTIDQHSAPSLPPAMPSPSAWASGVIKPRCPGRGWPTAQRLSSARP